MSLLACIRLVSLIIIFCRDKEGKTVIQLLSKFLQNYFGTLSCLICFITAFLQKRSEWLLYFMIFYAKLYFTVSPLYTPFRVTRSFYLRLIYKMIAFLFSLAVEFWDVNKFDYIELFTKSIYYNAAAEFFQTHSWNFFF